MKKLLYTLPLFITLVACTTQSDPTVQSSNNLELANAAPSDDVAVIALQPEEIKRRIGQLLPYCFASLANAPIDGTALVSAGYQEKSASSIGKYYIDNIRPTSTFKNQIDYVLYPNYRGKCIISTPLNTSDMNSYPTNVVQVMLENGYRLADKPGGTNTYRFQKAAENIQIWIKPNYGKQIAGLEVTTF